MKRSDGDILEINSQLEKNNNVEKYFHQKTDYSHCFYDSYTIVRIFKLKKIGVLEYPNIEIPSISVSTAYTGASVSIIERNIIQQVENFIAGI